MNEEEQIPTCDVKLAGITNGSETNIDPTHEIYIDPALEERVMRKFDKFVLPQFAILVLIAYLDRSNIGETPRSPLLSHYEHNAYKSSGNAKLFGLETSLQFTGNDF